jgi:hypothetical protein
MGRMYIFSMLLHYVTKLRDMIILSGLVLSALQLTGLILRGIWLISLLKRFLEVEMRKGLGPPIVLHSSLLLQFIPIQNRLVEKVDHWLQLLGYEDSFHDYTQ